jgi:hypothetical protein
MQTFLPYQNFDKTARVLDYRRLGKQRVEAWQILRALNGETRGWVNHPVTKMWNGYEDALAIYGYIMCAEWKRRGYKDTMTERFRELINGWDPEMPPWWGREDFHESQQRKQVQKFPEYYREYFPYVRTDLEYVWPASTSE